MSDDLDSIQPFVANDTESDLRFSTQKFVLQKVLEKASTVIPTRNFTPMLKNFLFDISDSALRVTSTDNELSLITQTRLVTVEREGSAVFPANRMMSMLREAEDGDVVVDVSKGKATIKVGTAEWSLQLMDAAEWPQLPKLEAVELIQIDRAKFLKAIESVRYAVATDEVHQGLMMIDVKDGRMRGSDSRRFQQIDTPFLTFDFQIPVSAIDDLVKLLKLSDASEIAIGQTEYAVIFNIVG